MSFAVMAETHEGATFKLRGGFATRDAAEDHPVTLKLWKHVWVAEIEEVAEKVEQPAVLPPLPWDWVASMTSDANGAFHAYLVDANGRKIAAIWGGNARALIADFILNAVNKTQAA